MAKIRVPKELRPPKRFEGFADTDDGEGSGYPGLFRCTGAFRTPKLNELYWSAMGEVLPSSGCLSVRRVILERVK